MFWKPKKSQMAEAYWSREKSSDMSSEQEQSPGHTGPGQHTKELKGKERRQGPFISW
jgi:hypothetical protein